jgi:hypothetical protein
MFLQPPAQSECGRDGRPNPSSAAMESASKLSCGGSLELVRLHIERDCEWVQTDDKPWGAALARLAQPSVVATLARDLFHAPAAGGDFSAHLKASIEWLCRAHDAAGGRGVSAAYSLTSGWEPPYPETTGYIIPTFYDYAAMSGKEEFRERARRMAAWELEVQLPSGAIPAGYSPRPSKSPAVFNTGQVILGWCRVFHEEGDERFLDAARLAGEWLRQVQGEDGAWRLETPVVATSVHAYDVRTAWSLLELHACTGKETFAAAAARKLQWAIGQQQEDGWFANNAFGDQNPYTHTIAYVMEGLLESWRLTGNQSYWDAAFKTAERLLRTFQQLGFLPGEFDSRWVADTSYSCLTGSAQVAGVWLQVYEAKRDTRFLDAAVELIRQVNRTQSITARHPGVRGGVKGSQPFWGKYTPYTFPNWGAKFLADTLMRVLRVTGK